MLRASVPQSPNTATPASNKAANADPARAASERVWRVVNAFCGAGQGVIWPETAAIGQDDMAFILQDGPNSTREDRVFVLINRRKTGLGVALDELCGRRAMGQGAA